MYNFCEIEGRERTPSTPFKSATIEKDMNIWRYNVDSFIFESTYLHRLSMSTCLKQSTGPVRQVEKRPQAKEHVLPQKRLHSDGQHKPSIVRASKRHKK
jgi:hypothetical protein